MRFTKTYPLLLLPALATALAPDYAHKGSGALSKAKRFSDDVIPDSDGYSTRTGSKGGDKETVKATVDSLASRVGVPTKDAPVDGKDGKPHLGPFVETDSLTDRKTQNLPKLDGRPDDPTIVDGKKIPQSNDGIMFDKNREHPEEGTTGLEGGVSEKSRQKKVQESKTGEKPVAKPKGPKEQLTHGIPTRDGTDASDAQQAEKKDDTVYTGLDKPNGLPDRTHSQPPPVPETASKDPLDMSGGAKTHATATDDDDEGIIQPFHSFILSFTMILVSEVGDKTFLVAALMAMKHDRMLVFSAAFGALLVMTVLSAVLGHAVPTLIPKRVTSFLAAGLFFVFGARLLREGLQMDPHEGVTAELHEVEQELAEKEKESGRPDYALEMGMSGGERGRANGRYSPPRSPSQSPPARQSGASGLRSLLSGSGNLIGLLVSPAWVQTFVMTFLGEWGDRSQIATIAMAAGQDYWWVTLGAMCGHCICTGVAVIGGRAIAGRVSLKVVTVGGAVAFLLFGFIYFIEALYG